MPYDFANLLFSGACNARCNFCIGRQIDPRLNHPNLDEYPPRNLEAFIRLIQAEGIRQVAFTGTNTDPQLYRHEAPLLEHLRRRLPAQTQFSLHTNGLQALHKMEHFNLYDRACLSLPSLDATIYHKVMGRSGPPDLAAILERATVPVKISCVVTRHNAAELPDFLHHLARLGICRVALRKLYGELRPWQALLDWERLDLTPAGDYQGNPVYTLAGMQVTLWDFTAAQSRAINLFSDGTLSREYLLAEAPRQEPAHALARLNLQPQAGIQLHAQGAGS
jgi:MoaA/NifB/PqqE/SkfB family radical SAM enzyme